MTMHKVHFGTLGTLVAQHVFLSSLNLAVVYRCMVLYRFVRNEYFDTVVLNYRYVF